MMRVWIPVVVSGLLLGCVRNEPPALEISDVRVYAPLPGSQVSVAYMTITNNSSEDVTFVDFSSDVFNNVELHETTVTDGIARMRALPALVAPAGASTELAEGGKHLMLMDPDRTPGLGTNVTLTLNTADGSIVISATLEARIRVD